MKYIIAAFLYGMVGLGVNIGTIVCRPDTMSTTNRATLSIFWPISLGISIIVPMECEK